MRCILYFALPICRAVNLYPATAQRLERRHIDPASITLTLDLSPAQPWKRPIQWSLKDFDNTRLVIKHDIYEVHPLLRTPHLPGS